MADTTSETINPQAPTPAEQLGLKDGAFNVVRTSGDVQTGWTIEQIHEIADEAGQLALYATIIREEPDGSVLEKTIDKDTLIEWQPKAHLQTNEVNYDHLFQVDPNEDASKAEAVDAPLSNERREAATEHQKRVFAPLLRPEIKVTPNYDDLFSDEQAIQQKGQADRAKEQEIRNGQTNYDRFVTEETRQQAAGNLTKALVQDRKLRTILDSFADRIDLSDPIQVVDALRTDADLRLEAGIYLVDKVDDVVESHRSEIPMRVGKNEEKATNGLSDTVIGKVSSREYVALLCLAKLDGSFNDQLADEIDYDATGQVILGQHRTAADIVLAETA